MRYLAFLLFLPVLAQAIVPFEKPSLKDIGLQIKQAADIVAAFKMGLSDQKKLKALEDANKIPMKQWTTAAQSSNPFVRGEIDDEAILSQILTLQQLSVLRARFSVSQKDFKGAKSALAPWFTFAADLPYEEATLIGLRFANLVRSLLLDEIETYQKSNGSEISKNTDWIVWANGFRAPWPIDRIILTEAKRVIRGKGMYTAQQMAIALQKNAYQTATEALKNAQGPKVPELQFLEQMWRTQDIESMKMEVNRINILRIKLAGDRYLAQMGKNPTKIEDLVIEKLLSVVPINYATGNTFTLSEIH